MPGPRPRHESGATAPVTVRLSPAHHAALRRLAASNGLTRSEAVAQLIDTFCADRVLPPVLVAEEATRAPLRNKGRRPRPTPVEALRAACPHRQARTVGRGPIMECPDCGVRGINLRP